MTTAPPRCRVCAHPLHAHNDGGCRVTMVSNTVPDGGGEPARSESVCDCLDGKPADAP